MVGLAKFEVQTDGENASGYDETGPPGGECPSLKKKGKKKL